MFPDQQVGSVGETFNMKPTKITKAPVTRIRFHLKTERYCCGFTFCLHRNDENDYENANI